MEKFDLEKWAKENLGEGHDHALQAGLFSGRIEGFHKACELIAAEFDKQLAETEMPNHYEKGALVVLQRVIDALKGP